MSVNKVPMDKGKDPTEESPEALQAQGQRMLKRIRRSFGSGWALYRHSKTGLAGLGIVIGFLVFVFCLLQRLFEARKKVAAAKTITARPGAAAAVE